MEVLHYLSFPRCLSVFGVCIEHTITDTNRMIDRLGLVAYIVPRIIRRINICMDMDQNGNGYRDSFTLD
jgi:hypothetical protein